MFNLRNILPALKQFQVDDPARDHNPYAPPRYEETKVPALAIADKTVPPYHQEYCRLLNTSSLEAPFAGLTPLHRAQILNRFLELSLRAHSKVLIHSGPLEVLPPDADAKLKIQELANRDSFALLLRGTNRDSTWAQIATEVQGVRSCEIADHPAELRYFTLSEDDLYICSAAVAAPSYHEHRPEVSQNFPVRIHRQQLAYFKGFIELFCPRLWQKIAVNGAHHQ